VSLSVRTSHSPSYVNLTPGWKEGQTKQDRKTVEKRE